jgi:hypothetical protein
MDKLCLLIGLIGMPLGPLAFERTEKRLHDGIVVTVGLDISTHTDLDAHLSQPGLIGATGVLAAAFREWCSNPASGCRCMSANGLARSTNDVLR